jgi:tRNA A-37 threonylcarbamoyl transferase component Bud32/tetratricopeptide (TPR) repeat protein
VPDVLDRLQAAITDRYVLGRELGRGGMATVYLAQDLKHDRPVAIKVLHPELGSLLGPERFQREIRLAARFQHPNILPVYDSGAGEGILWFTMPYVEGDTLRRRLLHKRPFPVSEAVSVLGDIARALAYAHRRGVIHRDVKPENVMVGDDYVLLTDFGVARLLDSSRDSRLTIAGVVVGTPAYMAPEQASAEVSIDHRVDIYALGVLAYELLVGEPPFTNLELGPLLVAHAIRDPVPIAARRPEVPPVLADLVARCLRKDPAERWSSADALCQALRTVASVGPTGAAAVRDPSNTDGLALEDLDAARAAFERRTWREAYVRFAAANATGALEAEDLERLAEAAWWVAEGTACIRAREQAYRRYLQRGEPGAAAAVALALAEDHFHRLARSVGQGWLRRAERHLDGLPETTAHGWLSRLHMLVALEVERDPQEAMKHADRALEIARRVGDTDLEALAIQDHGRILVGLGRVADGMALIDDAMTFATAGELTPRAAGRTYCNMISTCERLGDYGRAAEWHDAAHRWSEPHADSVFPGICRVHRAGILRLRGALPEAEQEARRATEELGDFLKDVAGEAFYELGEIRLRMGDHHGADAMFAEAHARGRDPQPGLALLRLAQENGEAARSMIERSLAVSGLGDLDRAKLLPALVEIAVACGAIDAAADAAAELEAITMTYTSPALVASAALARGTVELARGKTEDALAHLRRSRRIWTEIDLPFELARTRLLMSRAYSALGDRDEAAMEERSALAITSRIGVVTGR